MSENAMEQIAAILTTCEKVISKEKPERLLILGDTNSALVAMVAKRKGIPVFHMEAGNRCYNLRPMVSSTVARIVLGILPG